MLLRTYLTETGTSYAKFARLIGVSNASVVMRYVNGRVPRRRNVMDAIVRETAGAVQPNDFYPASAE